MQQMRVASPHLCMLSLLAFVCAWLCRYCQLRHQIATILYHTYSHAAVAAALCSTVLAASSNSSILRLSEVWQLCADLVAETPGSEADRSAREGLTPAASQLTVEQRLALVCVPACCCVFVISADFIFVGSADCSVHYFYRQRPHRTVWQPHWLCIASCLLRC